MNTLTVKTLGKAEVIVDIVAKGNYEIRPAYAMNPTEIAIHNTGNASRGADAEAHRRYLHNMGNKAPKDTGYASYHFVLDDKKIIQLLPISESAWHTGDGNSLTSGNRTSIGIEICQNVDMENYDQAEENAIALIVHLMELCKISATKVKPHQDYSGKYCPRIILNRDGGFDKFRSRVEVAYAIATKPVVKVAAVKPVSKPVSKPVVKPVVVPKGSYRVVSGDTLSEISTKFHMTVAELKAMNGMKSDLIRIGQIIKVDMGYKVGTVTKDVWLHNKADFNNSSRVRVLKAGEKYRIYGEKNGMYNAGTNAYVSKSYIKI